MAATTEGLRERKKRQTRAAIAAAAAKLFARNGFEAVTVAQVARAADVSEQTVFNYFPSKDDLVFDQDDELQAQLVALVRELPAGASLTAAMRAHLERLLKAAGRPGERDDRGMVRLIAGSPALQARARAMFERHAEALADALAARTGADARDLRPRTAAHALVSVQHATLRAFGERLLAGEERGRVAAELRDASADALALLAPALDRYTSSADAGAAAASGSA